VFAVGEGGSPHLGTFGAHPRFFPFFITGLNNPGWGQGAGREKGFSGKGREGNRGERRNFWPPQGETGSRRGGHNKLVVNAALWGWRVATEGGGGLL